MTPSEHLQAAKEAVAKKYGYISFDDINFYEIDALLQTTEPPYAEERIVEEMMLLALTNQAEEADKNVTRWRNSFAQRTQDFINAVNLTEKANKKIEQLELELSQVKERIKIITEL